MVAAAAALNPWWFRQRAGLAAAGLSTAFLLSTRRTGPLPPGMFVLGCGLVLLHTLPPGGAAPVPLGGAGDQVASGLAFVALGLPPDVLWVAILVAVYSVAAYGDRWVALAGLAVAEVGWQLSSSPRAGLG